LMAATEVIVDHYFQHLNIALSAFQVQVLYLFPGVPVFFIISGYLISASYERNANLRVYIKNRALRIFPGLWGCILVTIIAISITGVSFFNKQTIAWLPCQLVGIIYTPGFLSNYGFGSYNGSLWTIPIELQFYILLPLCYLLLPQKRRNAWLICFFILFLILNAWFGLSNLPPALAKLLRYSFIPNFYLFLLGVLLQRFGIYKSRFIYNKGLYWIVAYLTFCLLLYPYLHPVAFQLVKNILLSGCIVSMAYSAPSFSSKLLKGNDISYGIYIYHGLILTIIVQLKLSYSINVYSLIVFSYLLGYLSWIIIERPFIKRKEKTIRLTVNNSNKLTHAIKK